MTQSTFRRAFNIRAAEQRQSLQPLVSIIIPTYNRCNLLQEAVESCLTQSYTNVEVVIVDDGSTDDTAQHVAGRLRTAWGGKVIYRPKPNGGASSSKNLGMRIARGEYIQFLDSDDLLRPEKLRHHISAINANADTVDCCLCFGRSGDVGAGWQVAQRIGEPYLDVRNAIRRQCERTVHVMHTEAPLWRAGFLRENAGWREDLLVAEEWEYYIRLFTRQPRCVLVEEDLFWVRAHPGHQLSKDFGSLQNSVSFYKAIRSVSDLLYGTPFWIPEVQRGLSLRARTTYANLLSNGDPEIVREFETWFLTLVPPPSDLPVRAMILLRRWLGTARFVRLSAALGLGHKLVSAPCNS
jgi:glycosyltransferase involved in cell wall biosynthesis